MQQWRLAFRNRGQEIAQQRRIAGEGNPSRRGIFVNFEHPQLADFLNIYAQKAAFLLMNAFNGAARTNDLEALAFFNALL